MPLQLLSISPAFDQKNDQERSGANYGQGYSHPGFSSTTFSISRFSGCLTGFIPDIAVTVEGKRIAGKCGLNLWKDRQLRQARTCRGATRCAAQTSVRSLMREWRARCTMRWR